MTFHACQRFRGGKPRPVAGLVKNDEGPTGPDEFSCGFPDQNVA